jgi:hypothetical protein
VDEFVAEHTNQPRGDDFIPADVNLALIETGRRKSEKTLKATLENPGIVENDRCLALRAQSQLLIGVSIRGLEHFENPLLEAAGTSQPRGLIDVDILEEYEMRGFSLLEMTIGSIVESVQGIGEK